jgi:cob(I)alamin adenosyltransferase
MPIYTRTGDKGKTSLFSGQRVSKFDLRIEICGTVDELNSMIGVALSIKHQVSSIRKELIKIQNDLLEIGTALASPRLTRNFQLIILNSRVIDFERFMDKMIAQMPKLNNFILPGGGKIGAMLHLTRAVCRRLERGIVELNEKQKTDSNIIIYFNRLSDLLFTMARFANFKEKKKERVWKKKQG